MNQSDEDLLAEARSGSRAAWAALFERHQGRIYRFTLRMRGSESIADEVVQETFLDLLRGGLRFDPSKGAFASYLLGVARVKSHRLAANLGNGDGLDGLVSKEDPARDAEKSERAAALHRAILALPEHYREPVVLCELEELSYEQAADVLACPIGTVRSRLSRARQLLLERLSD